MGDSKNSSKRVVYSDTSLSQEKEVSKIKNVTFHLKDLEKER